MLKQKIIFLLFILGLGTCYVFAQNNENELNDAGLFVKACSDGDVVQIEKLLKKGVPIDSKDAKGSTGLYMACLSNRIEVVKLLIDEGVSKNDINKEANYVAREGKLDILRLFLDAGAEIEDKSFVYACEAYRGFLSEEIEKKANPEVVKLLLNVGVDVNAKTDMGRTALMAACDGGDYECAKILLDKGAEVNAKTKYGQTALMFAAKAHDVKLCQLLLFNGADINAKDANGNCAYIYSIAGTLRSAEARKVAELLEMEGTEISLDEVKQRLCVYAIDNYLLDSRIFRNYKYDTNFQGAAYKNIPVKITEISKNENEYSISCVTSDSNYEIYLTSYFMPKISSGDNCEVTILVDFVSGKLIYAFLLDNIYYISHSVMKWGVELDPNKK